VVVVFKDLISTCMDIMMERLDFKLNLVRSLINRPVINNITLH